MHEELVQLISASSDDISSSHRTSINDALSNFTDSSTSFSLLPAEPKIFNGRESELDEIVESLRRDEPARIAILGMGGIGKTSLARAALHHPRTTEKYQQRFFIACESAASSKDLALLVGSHLGLKPEKNPTKAIIRFFENLSYCLLVLDNLETPWEVPESRAEVEEFLSLLTDIPQLALIVTLRGAERPTKVRWTRPFLAPLDILSNEAARQTFIDIADEVFTDANLQALLNITGNLPLAINLIAHLVDDEGCAQVLDRWEREKIFLLSEGYDKRSNLELSLKLSLSSPRIASYPDALDFLGLFSLLPDGLSDLELHRSNLPIRDLLTCKAALLRTSLAYVDRDNRLKVLAPIREYIIKAYPPRSELVHPLHQYFHTLLQLYRKYHGHQLGQVVDQIIPNLGNVQSIVQHCLNLQNPHLRDTLTCAMTLNGFHRTSNRGRSISIDRISPLVDQLGDSRIKVLFITQLFLSWFTDPIPDAQALIDEAKIHLSIINDPAAECKFYYAAGPYFSDHERDVPQALKFFQTALKFSLQSGDPDQQCIVLIRLAMVSNMIGNYPEAQSYSSQAETLARQTGNLFQESAATFILSNVYMVRGDFKNSMILCHRARECMALCGLAGGENDFKILRHEAEVHSQKTEYAEARALYAQIIRETSPELSPMNYGFSLLNIAAVDIVIGADLAKAEADISKAKAIFHAGNTTHEMILCDMIVGDLKLREGDISTGKRLLEKTFNALRGYDIEGMLYCLEKLGDVSRWNQKDTASMSSWTILFLGLALKARNNVAINQALAFMGDVFVAEGDNTTAISLFGAALKAFSLMDIHMHRGNCLLRLGDIHQRRGDLVKAVEHWNSARPLFERSSQMGSVKQIDERLARTDVLT
ncbi:hypothetical protein C8R43DRAFT_589849 [Mycena crocata]|nr:hypothetical protein C8R43DRAFT_589849 [Mycena crocata]